VKLDSVAVYEPLQRNDSCRTLNQRRETGGKEWRGRNCLAGVNLKGGRTLTKSWQMGADDSGELRHARMLGRCHQTVNPQLWGGAVELIL